MDITLQKDFITDLNDNYIIDFVGRFEDIDNSFECICNTLGIKSKLHHTNKSKHSDYRHYYDKEAKEIIARSFAEDITKFKYSF